MSQPIIINEIENRLKLSGGTLSASSFNPITLNNTNSASSGTVLRFEHQNTSLGSLGNGDTYLVYA